MNSLSCSHYLTRSQELLPSNQVGFSWFLIRLILHEKKLINFNVITLFGFLLCYNVLIKSSEIRVVVLSYCILHVQKMAFSSLQSFRDLLLSGDETSALKCFNELDTCSIIQSDAVDLTQLPRDDLGTSLIPDDIAAKPSGNPVALKSTGNGNCLYNSASLLLCGDESRSEGLRILVAGELYFNAEYYADHEIFRNTVSELSEVQESTLFTVALSVDGDQILAGGGSRIDAIKAEALAGCKNGVWGSLVHMMALASVIRRPIYSLYPEVTFRYRPLMHKLLNPREASLDCEVEPLFILWSRQGSLDNRPNTWFTPNHFVPVIWIREASPDGPAAGETTAKSTGSKRGTILSFFKSSQANNKTPASSSSVKRSAEKAELNEGIAKKSKTAAKRKFLSQWKDEFPWVVFHEDQNVMTCKICCSAPHVAGRTEFLAGCGTFKKETLQKHNVGGGHLRARDVVLAKQKPVENSTIAQSFQKGETASEERNRKDVAVKINTAYLIAKEELPFSKFEPILALQRN